MKKYFRQLEELDKEKELSSEFDKKVVSVNCSSLR